MGTLIAWINRAVWFGTVIMFGSVGEIITERSGNLNLGVPGIMFLGGFAGFSGAYYYENSTDNPSSVLIILIAMVCGLAASALGGLIYSFLTITLRANQNVTGLALTTFGTGVANFFGVQVLNGGTSVKAAVSHNVFAMPIPGLSGLGAVGQIFFSYGFMVYLAIILALVANHFIYKTRAGLNLRAVGENPATADSVGINVTKYKYIATCVGAAISGLGGVYYVLDYGYGTWATNSSIDALGWLAVALVIFATWRPVNAIWGAYVFGIFFWLYNYLPSLVGITMPNYAVQLTQMFPYIVTILVLIYISAKQKKDSLGPASLGLSYFREDR
ncbi:MAG: ABC transporter permease [Lachnospiraceae bacterium]|nr:ABC transporter permease [Lachnospiraceae bacterium]